MRISLNKDLWLDRIYGNGSIFQSDAPGADVDGERATLVDVVGQPEQVRRLQELGFRCGMSLEMIRAGSPCIVRLCGQTMCIRGNDFLNVLVKCED